MLLVIAPPTAGLSRQRATRSNTISSGGSWFRVGGWVSDPEHPAELAGGATLTVAGSGEVSINIQLNGGWYLDLQVRIDGSTVQSASSTRSISWSGTVVDGQQIEVWATRLQAGSTITTGSVDITPV